MSKIATEMSMTIDRRNQRAQAIIAQLMHALAPHLAGDVDRRELYEALHDVVAGGGWDVVTDEDRRFAGLPPRNEEGWTHAELQVLEYAKLQAMINPLGIVIPGNLNPT